MNILKLSMKVRVLVDKSVLINTVLRHIVFKILSIYCSIMCIINIIMMYHNVLVATYM